MMFTALTRGRSSPEVAEAGVERTDHPVKLTPGSPSFQEAQQGVLLSKHAVKRHPFLLGLGCVEDRDCEEDLEQAMRNWPATSQMRFLFWFGLV